MLKSLFKSLYMDAHALNGRHILSLIEPQPDAKLLDLGCDDGQWTMELGRQLQSPHVHGIEVDQDQALKAHAKGIQVVSADLSQPWPYLESSFDVVHSSFVIEHMCDIDHFMKESFRVLKPGGYTLICTENGSSWHNIIAAILGWQTFSSSCCSTLTKGLGNPLAQQRGEGITSPSQTHKVIFNYLGFVEFVKLHHFNRLTIRGAGYYPLPSWMGDLDHRHAHFLTIKAFKPQGTI